uniref:psbP domain-containing protein 2, chloroplastic n=1 Tax=Erigeron canadensis TaxID=72917 RepID=UPI001CB8DFCF|nr:psbP domain-containing protein 2, chloroplastic [Erigeron canadensis]
MKNALPQKMITMISSNYSSCGLGFLKINPTHPQSNTHCCVSCNLQHINPNNNNKNGCLPTTTRRRDLLTILTVTPTLSILTPTTTNTWAQTDDNNDDFLELKTYTDVNQGFTLLIPASWTKVEKAGATVLFEDPSKGSNNVGVVVTPVRLNKLSEFGDPQFVSNKLIQAEKRKESTKDVEIVSFKERPGQKKDIQVYEFEYKLDSTRGGLKTIFSAAFVASKKLYLLNIAHSDNPQQPMSNHRRMMLEQVLHSFDVLTPSSTTTFNTQV